MKNDYKNVKQINIKSEENPFKINLRIARYSCWGSDNENEARKVLQYFDEETKSWKDVPEVVL